ncbi:putative pilus system protein FilA [Acinetobacter junii]|uniref:putative pilus system protein FilA n=1 Tax=Acinetobacter junii TaxID=40215 RepID=UPI00385070C5
MKMFTKLALVSSMAISANAMAMQAMDDAALSSATGQDGINIGIGAGLNADLATFMGSAPATTKGILVEGLYVHDNDGLAATAAFNGVNLGGKATAGAIHIAGLGLQATAGADNFDGTASTNLLNLKIDTDAGDATAGGAFLNIGANVAALRVKVGAISVGASGAAPDLTAANIRRGTTGTENQILTGLTLDMGKVAANVQLGATPQGAMVLVKSSLSGLNITNLGINDAAGGGQIYLDGLHVRGAGGGNIDVDLGISVKSTGLEIKNNSTAGNDVYVKAVRLGAAATGSTNASIGDVEVQGLKLGQTTITIAGH